MLVETKLKKLEKIGKNEADMTECEVKTCEEMVREEVMDAFLLHGVDKF